MKHWLTCIIIGIRCIYTADNLIKQWAKSFIKLFKEYSLSELQLPKLHNWCYHIIKTIREYGAINRFTMETYEFLHKDAVKIPYRSSNKHDPTDQMIKLVDITASTIFNALSQINIINISWYSYANISSSGNYIRAKSLYYNELSFSDVSISMSEEESEDYNTAEGGAYFSKVSYVD
ncbi:kinase-like domain-containing protein [Rhizophagus irregularis DAOM 181602=DAOM 197198]|nr:kinase-like domain-containing protein [Rhizophagus irregularis DAOM 181602=DAOM 197198]